MKEYSIQYLDNYNKEKFLLEVHLIKNAADFNTYDQYLKQLPENPFIKKELFPNTADQDIGYFTLHDSRNTLLVLLPFIYRKICLKKGATEYYDIMSPYGLVGPVMNSNIDERKMMQFWEQVDKWYLQNDVVTEFIRFSYDNNYLGYTGLIVPAMNMVCGKIRAEDQQWENFKPKVRNNVRRALSSGLKGIVYHRNIGQRQIEDFFNIYSKTMDRHNAESRYRYSLEFFKEFILNNPDSCALAIVYKKNVAISMELLLLSNKVVYSFLGGTNEAYFNTRPNDLLKFVVINWSRENGYVYYFLGGGKVENDTLYQYKKCFFPKDADRMFYTGRKVLNPEMNEKLVSLNPNCSDDEAKSFFPLYRYKLEE